MVSPEWVAQLPPEYAVMLIIFIFFINKGVMVKINGKNAPKPYYC